MNKKGFTLIELLVAVLIVAILSTIGMIGYRSAVNKNNDARKVEDMQTIQKVLEQYYAIEQEYPGTCYSAGDTVSAAGTMIMQDFPSSPDSTSYSSSDCSTTSYCYCAEMTVSDGNSGADDCSNWSGTGYYCVDARQ